METLFEASVILYPDENKISYFGHIVYNPSQKLLDMISKQLHEQEIATVLKADEYGWCVRAPCRLPILPDTSIINEIYNDTTNIT